MTARVLPAYIHTLQLGTLTIPFDRMQQYGVIHMPFAAFLAQNTQEMTVLGHPMLGTIGLSALGRFETIIDYTHRRLVLIRLDSAGRRLVAVPQYTPQATARLVPVDDHTLVGVEGTVAKNVIPFLLDTGSPEDELDSATVSQLGLHTTVVRKDQNQTHRVQVDHLRIGDRHDDRYAFTVTNTNILGFPFLRMHSVVGLNFRTRQLVFYQQ